MSAHILQRWLRGAARCLVSMTTTQNKWDGPSPCKTESPQGLELCGPDGRTFLEGEEREERDAINLDGSTTDVS